MNPSINYYVNPFCTVTGVIIAGEGAIVKQSL